MTGTTIEAVFTSYLDAFAATSASDRDRLLRTSVAEDVAFSNPGVDGEGRDALATHVVAFQRRFPGGRFEVRWLWCQHHQLLAQWRQLTADESEVMTAYSYAQLNDHQVLGRIAGFWAPDAI